LRKQEQETIQGWVSFRGNTYITIKIRNCTQLF